MPENEIDYLKLKAFVEVESESGDTLISKGCASINDLLKFKCKEGKNFEATPREYYNGYRCRRCTNGTHKSHIYREGKESKIKFVESKGYKVKDFIDRDRMIVVCLQGHKTILKYNDFKNTGRRCQECGKSSGETAIKEYFLRNNITFIFKYRNKKCYDNGVLEFDFAVYKNSTFIGIVEYDGKCHYRAKDIYGYMDGLLEHQRRDKIKTDFCLKNNIPLLRIPYWEINHIDDLLEGWLKIYFA